MSIASVNLKISNITTGGENTAKEVRELFEDLVGTIQSEYALKGTSVEIEITESQISDLGPYNNYIHPTGDGNLHIPASGTTNSGKVLTATAVGGVYTWTTVSTTGGTNDHELLTNIGVKTHDEIDTHIIDVSKHFTQAEISILASQISDLDNEISNNTSVAANTAKVGITPEQAAEIVVNNLKVSNVDHPLVETAVPVGALFTDTDNDTVYNDTAIQAAVALNTAKETNVDQDLSGYEVLTNKQDSLTADGTGNKFPTVDAVNAGLDNITLPVGTVTKTENAIFSSVNSNTIITLASISSAISWTGIESNLLKIVLTEDSVLENPSAPIDNALYQFIIEQDGTGLWTLSYGSSFKFPDGVAPVIDLNSNSKGILTALYDGTDLLVVSVQNFL